MTALKVAQSIHCLERGDNMIDVARVRTLITELYNEGNLDVIDELFAENFSGHDPQNPIEGREGMREWVQEIRRISPDIHLNLHETVAEGDMTATRWTFSGTHSAEFRGIPATNLPYVISGMTMSKFSEGKVVESWIQADNLGMLQQIGVVPQMAG